MSTGELNHVTIELARLAQRDSFSARIIALTYERKLAVDTTWRLFLLVEKNIYQNSDNDGK